MLGDIGAGFLAPAGKIAELPGLVRPLAAAGLGAAWIAAITCGFVDLLPLTHWKALERAIVSLYPAEIAARRTSRSRRWLSAATY